MMESSTVTRHTINGWLCDSVSVAAVALMPGPSPTPTIPLEGWDDEYGNQLLYQE